ncbi:MAG TPA: 16S rRNA (guanine(966)-N(2))-methyltransferase RsmD [Candidatus Saccharimonadales bacterium]|nr:16S rRNA (guanine(966)-N(2))-methyltransferase RsmD [Candidatus Saccharimonadales bacterium]
MNIRIIGGYYGGQQIAAPKNRRTHPMSERIRNALFNSLASEITDAEVLDVFAGTGAIGLEALSRGAKSVTFVDRDRTAQRYLTRNVASIGVQEQSTIIRTTVSSWLGTKNPKLFDIIFADPPYYDVQFSTVERIFDLLKPGGLMVLSHPGRGEVPTKTGVVVVDNRSYGNAYLTFYRRDA